ncbi:Pyrimidine-nucleoside phosphorylase [compost metagenome]
MVYLAGKASSLEEAEEKLKEVIKNGKALEKFKEFVTNQGGDASIVDHPEKLPQADYLIEVPAKSDGVVAEIVADEIGTAAMLLGAGRATKESEIDLAVGLMLNKKIGDQVKAGESLVTIHANREQVDEVIELIYANIRIADHAEAPVLVHDIVTE